MNWNLLTVFFAFVIGILPACNLLSPNLDTPDLVVRKMFQANADRDLNTIDGLVSKDADMVGYTIGGRKYVGWHDVNRDMRMEFESVSRLEIPIRELRVWEHGDVAWYTVDIDYIRYEGSGSRQQKTILPLRESGVLERRQGRWLLVQWHESLERDPVSESLQAQRSLPSQNGLASGVSFDLSGEWEIQEADKTYQAVLDKSGQGHYTWQNGAFTTTYLDGERWEGTWHQSGNDREGGFALRFSNDRQSAKGTWWYTRVGTRSNIPPRQWGGDYRFKRVDSNVLHYPAP